MLAVARLPTYTLYGEVNARPATDWLHWESIAERSSRHRWQIQAHRHATLFQILYIRRGRGEATIDAQVSPLRGPCLLTVPALVPHGFRFKPGIDGSVFTVLQAHIEQLLAATPELPARVLQPRVTALRGDAIGAVDRAAAQLKAEFLGTQAWRALAIDAALCALLVALERAAPAAPSRSAPRAVRARRCTWSATARWSIVRSAPSRRWRRWRCNWASRRPNSIACAGSSPGAARWRCCMRA